MKHPVLVADRMITLGSVMAEEEMNLRQPKVVFMKLRDIVEGGLEINKDFILHNFGRRGEANDSMSAIQGGHGIPATEHDPLASAKRELQEETTFKPSPPPRTLSFSGIWFVAHYDADGKVNGMEEHDWREGGGIEKRNAALSWEDYFVERVMDRIKGDGVEELAREFLQGTGNFEMRFQEGKGYVKFDFKKW